MSAGWWEFACLEAPIHDGPFNQGRTIRTVTVHSQYLIRIIYVYMWVSHKYYMQHIILVMQVCCILYTAPNVGGIIRSKIQQAGSIIRKDSGPKSHPESFRRVLQILFWLLACSITFSCTCLLKHVLANPKAFNIHIHWRLFNTS